MNQLISIIVPCYNQGEFLNDSLLSVCNQTYTNWECIIINDGSIDNSENIAKKWVDKDNRFYYYFKEKGGVSSARNLGLEKTNGNYIQFLDADDLLDVNKLELSLKCLSDPNEKNKRLVITNFKMFSKNIHKSTEPYCTLKEELFDFQNILYKWNETFSIPIHCGLFDASLFQEVRFPENLTAQEDWIVWIKIFKNNESAIFLNKNLAFYRINPNGRTMTESFYTDQLKAFEYLKTIISEDDFYKLSTVLISRYFISSEDLKRKLNNLKSSNTFQTGLMIKKVLKKLGILSPSKNLFLYILKFKKK